MGHIRREGMNPNIYEIIRGMSGLLGPNLKEYIRRIPGRRGQNMEEIDILCILLLRPQAGDAGKCSRLADRLA